MYAQPQQNLKIVLKVSENSDKSHAAEFLLEEDCFEGEWPWWALFMKVKRVGTDTNHNQKNTTYKLQVRTSTCIKQRSKTASIRDLDSLNIWASGDLQWKYNHLRDVLRPHPHWNTDAYQDTDHRCRHGNLMSPKPGPATPAPLPSPHQPLPSPQHLPRSHHVLHARSHRHCPSAWQATWLLEQ